MSAQSNLEILRSVFDAMGDADAVVAHYTDDYVLELPYFRPEGPDRVEGKEVVRERLVQAFKILSFTLHITEVYPCTDPDLVIAEYTSQGEVLPAGRHYSNRYIGLWRFRDGKVCFTREYLNPEIIRAALAPPAED
ncbi:nuclear transport factor 2 family protein [Candidatus Poriferisocius sp.]|uniref:nuclear transport factor 2 family protein n=1 Tax=Candidatus Poriferisocius sp. TaxID=3101276 RepID=UPI003B01F9FE